MENRIQCHEAIARKEDFFEQKLTYDQMAEIDKHLESCEKCRKEYEEYEKALFTDRKKDADSYDFSKFEYALTLKMIGKAIKIGAIALAVWFVLTSYILPMLFRNHVYLKSEKSRIALSDLVSFTMPTYRTASSNAQSGPWNHKLEIQLERTLIGEENYAGYIDAAVPLYVGEADIRLVDVHKSSKRYLLPSQRYYAAQNTGIPASKLEKIEALREGTKTQFSLSFNRPVTALEIDELVQKLNTLEGSSFNGWVAVDTGIDLSKDEFRFIRYRNPITQDLWGFPLTFFKNSPVSPPVRGESFSSSQSEGIQFETQCRQSSKNFIEEMKQLEEYSVYMDDRALTEEIKRINQYLSENEITFYGVILTAPTQNILNIKDVDFIGDMQIIKVDFDY